MREGFLNSLTFEFRMKWQIQIIVFDWCHNTIFAIHRL